MNDRIDFVYSGSKITAERVPNYDRVRGPWRYRGCNVTGDSSFGMIVYATGRAYGQYTKCDLVNGVHSGAEVDHAMHLARKAGWPRCSQS